MATIDGRRAAVREATRDAGTHAGLWLDKYLRALRLPELDTKREEKKKPDQEDQGTAIRALLEEAALTTVPEGYEAAFKRRAALLERLDGGVEGGVTCLFTAEASGRLVIGLGTQAVRETNLALLHTWGVPYLPGSALKGLASAAAHGLGASASWKKSPAQGEDHAQLFGDTKRAGYVAFHDAWWSPEGATLPLDLDVMTVHHPDYYRDGKAAPADWDEPNPVAFLTARGKYQVALSGPAAWVARAGEWLEAGLVELGLGAKTQAGYGRMKLARVPTRREEEEQAAQRAFAGRLATLRNLPAQHKGAPTAKQHIQKLRDEIAGGLPAELAYPIARDLFRREPKFWRQWAADARRTPEEKAFVSESGMLRDEPSGTPR